MKNFVPQWLRLLTKPFREQLRAWRFKRHIVKHTYAGFPLQVTLADPLARGWYNRDWPEDPSLSLLRSNQLKPGAKVFDLGAHQGVVAMMLSRIVEPEGRVIALEATERNANIAKENQLLNGIENLDFRYAAIAETSGTINFSATWNGRAALKSENFLVHPVKSFSIDDLANEVGIPNVIFLDVEGLEVHALRGARKTLAHKPDCDIEVHANGGLEKFGFKASDVLEFFPASDYQLYVYKQAITSLEPITNDFILPNHNFHLIAIAR